MTDIVLFHLHFPHLPTNRLDALHEEKIIKSVCIFLYVWVFMFGHVWWTCWHVCHAFRKYTQVSISLVLSPLLGCRRQSRKNNQGSHPFSHWPHFHRISNYCSQTQIKHQVELQSQGTWMGGGLKREMGVFLVRERDREMEGTQDIGARLYLPPFFWRPTRQGPKPGSRGLCRFNDLFPRDHILHLNYH